MSPSLNAIIAGLIIAAIAAAYVVARRMNQRDYNAKLELFSRRIKAAEQRDRQEP